MKEIKATIQPHMLSKVMSALHELPSFPGVTVFKCEGQGRGKGPNGIYIAVGDGPFFRAKERLEIICHDDQAANIVATIVRNAHTGNPGDGIVSVSTLDSVRGIRTNEEYSDAR